MINLFSRWDKLKGVLEDNFLYLFLDYDGTICPIAETPDKAVIPEEARQLLKGLAGIDSLIVAIISGRALEDIQKRVGVEGIVYVGNHGMEMSGPKVYFQSMVPPEFGEVLKKIKTALEEKLSGFSGVYLEDKGISLSIHYRQAKDEDAPKVKEILEGQLREYLFDEKVNILSGKMVHEVRPAVEWDKGKIALWLLARQRLSLKGKNILPVFLGDDVTDEDAFKALKNIGITVFVGDPGFSSASYYLNNTEEVAEFLKKTYDLKKGQNG